MSEIIDSSLLNKIIHKWKQLSDILWFCDDWNKISNLLIVNLIIIICDWMLSYNWSKNISCMKLSNKINSVDHIWL